MKKIVTILISLILVAGLIIGAKTLLNKRIQEKNHQSKPTNIKISVELTTPKEGNLTKKLKAFAKLQKRKTVLISTKIPGYIEDIFVQEATEFKKGQLLVKIDSKEITSSLKSLESLLLAKSSGFKYAKGVYERNLKLFEVGGLSKEMLDKSLTELKSQEASLKATKEQIAQLKNKLDYLSIKAPFDGVVDRVFLHKGDLAAKPILQISNSSQKITFTFVPDLISKVKTGAKVYLNDKVIGKVKSIYPSSIASLAQGEINLTKPLNLPSGVSFDVDIELENRSGCLIESQNILYKKDGAYIFVYDKNRFTPKRVNILLEDGDKVLIRECPKSKIAKASKSKLAILPSYKSVVVVGEKR